MAGTNCSRCHYDEGTDAPVCDACDDGLYTDNENGVVVCSGMCIIIFYVCEACGCVN